MLQHPDPAIGDCRSRPYTERRAFLLELLADIGPPIRAVPATDDRDVAVLWYDALREQGIEGILKSGFTADRLTECPPSEALLSCWEMLDIMVMAGATVREDKYGRCLETYRRF
ncbi:hypothetical protein [Streptomyces sp. NPDC053720]|uniref:hypothetical protein n=1 Tax=Streptomyces sp. NPDC053720 TaxID=3154855 RepID=UPI00343BFA9E